jgi:hypothetical protein
LNVQNSPATMVKAKLRYASLDIECHHSDDGKEQDYYGCYTASYG